MSYHGCGSDECPVHPRKPSCAEAPERSEAPKEPVVVDGLCVHGWVPRICRACQEYDAPRASAATRDEQDLLDKALAAFFYYDEPEDDRGRGYYADGLREKMQRAFDVFSASLAKPARKGGTNEPLLTDEEMSARVIEYHVERQHGEPDAPCAAFQNGAKWARDTITKRIQERREG